MPNSLVHGTAALALLLGMLGCGDSPLAPPCVANDAELLELPPLGSATLDASTACVELAGEGSRYLIVPQFASVAATTASFGYALGEPAPVARIHDSLLPTPGNTVQSTFDLALRRAEAAMAPATGTATKEELVIGEQTAPPPLNSQRTFRVLSTLDVSNPTYATVTARLRFIGDNILLYQDLEAPGPPGGFTDESLQALGALFDIDLAPLVVTSFGPVSDIDQNGRIIVLFTPVVNSLTSAATCATRGFVTGFFFGLDLSGTSPNSNRAEIYYSFVPDPQGLFSCPHSATRVEQIAPATFVHELQHMISYNHHVLQGGGAPEVLWLNEGLSHIAEELASLYYEDRFPPPTGRSNPDQIFPDSSQSFIVGNLVNSYNYLTNPAASSVTALTGTGTLTERGASWLFLRWLGDQKGANIYRQLVQTNRSGMANLEAASGEKFGGLFGDFSAALWTDSIPGVPREQIPARLRFQRRNLRQLYARLNEQAPSQFQRHFPIEVRQVGVVPLSSSMLRGTMDFFTMDTDPGEAGMVLSLTSTSGSVLARELGGQITVVRLP